MSEMVERVARAIWSDRAARILAQDSYARTMGIKSRGDYAYDELEQPMRDALGSEARAAIAAMREPTKEMLSDEYPLGAPPQALDSWRDMIDAALKESS